MQNSNQAALLTIEVQKTLDDLHQKAKGDYKSFILLLPSVLSSLVRGKGAIESISPKMLGNAYIPVNREQGVFLYNLAIASKSKMIVEFGSSFGISSIYLAAAAKDNQGTFITTEILPEKCRAAEENLKKANLDMVSEVWEGDATQTLKTVEETVDFLFLDGWKDLYNSVLDILLPRFKVGSIVVADNVNMGAVKKYMDRIQAPNSGFVTTVLNKNTAFSVYVGK